MTSGNEDFGFSLDLPQDASAIENLRDADYCEAASLQTTDAGSGYRIRCVNYIQIILPPMYLAGSESRSALSAIAPANPPSRTRPATRKSVARRPKALPPKRRGRPPKKRTRKSKIDSASDWSDSEVTSFDSAAESSSSGNDSDGSHVDVDVEPREAFNSTGENSIAVRRHIKGQPCENFFKALLSWSLSLDDMIDTDRVVPLFHSKIGRSKPRSPVYLFMDEEGFAILQEVYDSTQIDVKTYRTYSWMCVRSLQFHDDLNRQVLLHFKLYSGSPEVGYYKEVGQSTELAVEEEENVIMFVNRQHDLFYEDLWDNSFRLLHNARTKYDIPKNTASFDEVHNLKQHSRIKK